MAADVSACSAGWLPAGSPLGTYCRHCFAGRQFSPDFADRKRHACGCPPALKRAWMAFPAVLLAQVSGRAFFLLLVTLFQNVVPFTPAVIWGQIRTGLYGLALQAVLVPLAVIGLRRLADTGERDRD